MQQQPSASGLARHRICSPGLRLLLDLPSHLLTDILVAAGNLSLAVIFESLVLGLPNHAHQHAKAVSSSTSDPDSPSPSYHRHLALRYVELHEFPASRTLSSRFLFLSCPHAETLGSLTVAWLMRFRPQIFTVALVTAVASGGNMILLRTLLPEDLPPFRALPDAEPDKTSSMPLYPALPTSSRPVEKACANGHLDAVRHLLLNIRLPLSLRAFDLAAENGHLAVIAFLHETFGAPNPTRALCSARAMDGAAANGHVAVVRYLHENRWEGCTSQAVDKAAEKGRFEVVKYLLESRTEGCSPSGLFALAAGGQMELVKFLLEPLHRAKSGDGSAATRSGVLQPAPSKTAFAISSPSSAGIAKMPNFTIDATGSPPPATTLLHSLQRSPNYLLFATRHAAEHGHLDLVKYLESLDPTALRSSGVGGLMQAAQRGHLAVVDHLLSRPCPRTLREGFPMVTAVAAAEGRLEVLKRIEAVLNQVLTGGPQGAIDDDGEVGSSGSWGRGFPAPARFGGGGGRTEDPGRVFGPHAVDRAAQAGHMDVLEYLDGRKPRVRGTWQAVDAAAAKGMVDVLRFLFDRDLADRSPSALDAAAGCGQLEAVKFLHERGCAATVRAMDRAAENGHLEVVMFLHRNRGEGCTVAAMDAAARNGFVDVVKFLHANRGEGCTTAAMDGAAAGLGWNHGDDDDAASEPGSSTVSSVHFAEGTGEEEAAELDEGKAPVARPKHLEILKFLHEHRDEGCTVAAMDQAAANGILEVVEFLHHSRTEGCTQLAMDRAAGNGFLSVVKFLDLHRTEGCTSQAMDLAAQGNHLAVLRYLHDRRTEGCTAMALTKAAESGHMGSVRFLVESGRCKPSPDAVAMAARTGHVDVVAYLWERIVEAPQRNPAVDTLEETSVNGDAADHASQNVSAVNSSLHPGNLFREAVDKAVSRGNTDVVAFLSSRIPPFTTPAADFCTVTEVAGAAFRSEHWDSFRLLGERPEAREGRWAMDTIMEAEIRTLPYWKKGLGDVARRVFGNLLKKPVEGGKG
ncbi:hypothetical protein HDU96_006462 [Phlyctochytrium bullatum]|nr:hypothetical protein HDU96_006462 [Phlyctochytrium bullatum]